MILNLVTHPRPLMVNGKAVCSIICECPEVFPLFLFHSMDTKEPNHQPTGRTSFYIPGERCSSHGTQYSSFFGKTLTCSIYDTSLGYMAVHAAL